MSDTSQHFSLVGFLELSDLSLALVLDPVLQRMGSSLCFLPFMLLESFAFASPFASVLLYAHDLFKKSLFCSSMVIFEFFLLSLGS